MKPLPFRFDKVGGFQLKMSKQASIVPPWPIMRTEK